MSPEKNMEANNGSGGQQNRVTGQTSRDNTDADWELVVCGSEFQFRTIATTDQRPYGGPPSSLLYQDQTPIQPGLGAEGNVTANQFAPPLGPPVWRVGLRSWRFTPPLRPDL